MIALLDDAAAGRGGALVVLGAPGLGKTVLLDAARAAAGGFTLLSAAGNRDEAAMPHAGLQRLLAPVLRYAADLAPAQREVLLDAIEGSGDDGNRLACALAILGMLRAAAAERPVLCLLDDAHLLDEASWRLLTVVARRLDGSAIAFLAALGADFQPAALGEQRAARGAAGLPTCRLGPLEPAASRALLADLVPGLCGDVTAELVALAGGNPAALVEVAGALTPEQRRGDDPAPVTLPPGSGLRRAYRSAIGALGEDAGWLLLLAAADPDLDVAGLDAAATASGTALAVLEPAEAAGLITMTGPVLAFAEPVLRAVIYHDASPSRRHAAHAVLAEVLSSPGQRLRSLLHRAAATGGADEALARDLLAAAPAGTHLAASAASERAAELTACPQTAATALVAAAEHAWLAGQHRRARRLLRLVTDSAAADTPDPGIGHVRARVIRLAGEIDVQAGGAAVAREALFDAALRLVKRDPAIAADCLLIAGEAALLAGEQERYREVARLALALHTEHPAAGPERDPGTEAAFRHLAGLAAMFCGDHELAFAELRRVVQIAGASDDAATLVRAALAGLLVGDVAGTLSLAGRAVAAARARGESALVPRGLEIAACADLAAGRHDAAVAAATEGAALSRASGQPGLAARHLGLLAVLAALAGDRETCVRRVRDVGAYDSLEEPGQARLVCEWAFAVLDLVEGRPQAAFDRLHAVLIASPGHGNVVLQVAATPHLIEAAAGCGRSAPAEDAWLAFDRWAICTGNPAWLALRERCRALRATSHLAADGHFREALRQHAAGGSDFARAHTQLLFGRELRRRRRPAAAREHLRAAVETFRLLDARVWTAQADLELRAAGDHIAPRPAAAALALTAQQDRIARMVAEGATNREIAAQLFLSPRTVDHHLRNIFVRLGVRSRTELARLVVTA